MQPVKHQEISDTIQAKLEKAVLNALIKAFPDILKEEFIVEVTKSTQESFGDYQCNSAMKMAKLLRASPLQIAKKLLEALPSCDEDKVIESLFVAGPGFINITLRSEFLASRVMNMIKSKNLNMHASKRKKVVIDFSSPNIAKEMHVGHLRSTIIGDCLARVFEFLGHDVLRINHLGDWGTSFGMLIAYSEKMNLDKKLESMSLSELVAMYRKAKVLFDEDGEFKKQSQLAVVELQGGEKRARNIWHLLCEISKKAYKEIYDILDIHLIDRGESYYNDRLASTVKDLEEKGLVTISNGAKCIFLEGFISKDKEPLPLMIQKSDGGYNYDTTDMATIHQRIFEEKADHLVYVTDAGQSLHFQMVFQTARKAGYWDPAKVRVDHVPFGVVLGQDGKKFRTRSGETERLIDLLQQAVDKALEIVKSRNPDWSETEQLQVAKALGVGAVKYADLSGHRQSDYVFSYDRMLRFEGNTAAFIIYSYVRANSIKRKIGIDTELLISQGKIEIVHPGEKALALRLVQFPECLDMCISELLPNRITDYLYSLAETFNAFFRDCRVEGSLEQNSRLLLTECTARVLKQGLTLLGVETVERM